MSFKTRARWRRTRIANDIRADEQMLRTMIYTLRMSIDYGRGMRDSAAEGGPFAGIYAEEFARVVFGIPRERARIRELRRQIRRREADLMEAA